ncbi:arsenite efflux transporter metallochaperone ArsD [Bifidobacterium choerinum]|uniref:Arsenical resistance operon trans-acting repressor n=1 Tax=Bifidobacterium choerinum TaxID=35760 RepID=A0A087AEJ2_9BIFI|nr:arsenite efflux transporter metallochaperone ArsD [Bifidobacterium choerinum]KFI57192.1 arsenical resistance operon trans-acting repressor [Bifidobacterium choerinum]
MRQIDIYEPALCCSSGVCGGEVNQALVDFNAALLSLDKEGIRVIRHNLASEPADFAACEPVKAYLAVAGADGLPVTVVDGTIVGTGVYPQLDQLRRYAGADTQANSSSPSGESGCCCKGGCR